jgi:hypothetical protein
MLEAKTSGRRGDESTERLAFVFFDDELHERR